MQPPGRRLKGRPNVKFMDLVKEDIRLDGVTLEVAEYRIKPLKGKAKEDIVLSLLFIKKLEYAY